MPVADRLRRLGLPLRWRLVVAALLGAVCFAVGFAAFATWQVDRLEDRGLATALQARVELVRSEVTGTGHLIAGEPSPRTSLAQLVGPNGSVRDSTAALRTLPPLIPLRAIQQAGRSGVRRDLEFRRSRLTLLGVPMRMKASDGVLGGTGALIVGIDSEGFLAARDQLDSILAVGLGVIVPLAGLLAWILAGRALRTVTTLTEEAEAVGVSDIGRGLAVPASDPELSRLVAALNRMLGRVATGLEQERRFAADASHRLRTPLATLRAEAELALVEGDSPGMRHALEQVIADADNLTDLVNRLLAAHRSGPGDLLPYGEAIEAAAGRWRRQAGAAGLQLQCDLDHAPVPPVEEGVGVGAGSGGQLNGHRPEIDPHVLRSVLDPLVENAVQHTDSGGTVAVLPRHEGDVLVVDVRDTGHGVAPQVRDRLFRPWTTTRSERGGAGLGLWLARESARAAGGDVVLLDDRPGTTTFRVRLPLS